MRKTITGTITMCLFSLSLLLNVSVFAAVNPPLVVTLSDVSVCQGNSLVLQPVVYGGSNSYTNYVWTASADILSSTVIEQPTVKNTVAAGSYTLSLTVTDSDGTTEVSNVATLTVHQLPAVLVGSTSMCPIAGTQLSPPTITTPSGASIVSYSWTDMDGALTSTNILQPSYNGSDVTASTHNLELTVTDANGCQADDSGTLEIYETPVVTVPASQGTCSGTNLTISASTMNGTAPYTYLWTGSTGVLSADNIETPDISASVQAGTYTLTLVATDANGCVGQSNDVSFEVLQSPTIYIPDQSICEGADLVVNSSVIDNSGMSIDSYAWSIMSGATLTDADTQAPTVDAGTSAGSYIITSVVTDAAGCATTESATITINEAPMVTVNSTSICPVAGTLISTPSINTPSGAPVIGYVWTDPDGVLDNVNILQPSYNGSDVTASTHNLELTVTDANGCQADDSGTLEIYEKPIVTIPTGESTCAGAALGIDATTTDGFVAVDYAFMWSGAAGILNSVNIEDPDIVAGADAGVYALTLSATDDNGCTNSYTSVFEVRELPEVNVPDQKTCQGGAMSIESTVVDNSKLGIAAYKWTYDGNESLANDHTYMPSIPGTEVSGIYTVELEVTDAQGCKGIDAASVEVADDCTVGALDASTGNDSDLVLLPNPNTGTFDIMSDIFETGSVKISIFDVSGNLVYEEECSNEYNSFKKTMIVNNLSAGVYLLKAETASKTTTKRLVITD